MSKVIIGKGNYSLETEAREKEFERKRAIGFEEEYLEYRNKWVSLPKRFEISEYPLEVGLELSSICNLKCPFCYTITDEFKSKVSKRFMETTLAKQIIDEVAGKIATLRVSFRGESTLNPDFIDIIRYAKQKGIKEISFLTNGSNLTGEYFTQLLLAGVDWIIVSFDGLNEEYEKNRYPLKFNDTINKLKQIKKIKEKYNSEKPVIKVQSVWPAIEKDPYEFYSVLSSISDYVSFLPLIEYDNKERGEEYFIKDFSCPMLYQRLFVTSDGKVLPCCNDLKAEYVLGDAYNESIYDIWHGDKLNSLRNLFKGGYNYRKSKICKQCFNPRKTNDCIYKYDDKELVVKNYMK